VKWSHSSLSVLADAVIGRGSGNIIIRYSDKSNSIIIIGFGFLSFHFSYLILKHSGKDLFNFIVLISENIYFCCDFFHFSNVFLHLSYVFLYFILPSFHLCCGLSSFLLANLHLFLGSLGGSIDILNENFIKLRSLVLKVPLHLLNETIPFIRIFSS
jgi:hypothetical protein